MTDLFAADGALARALPGYVFRPQQAALADAVASALASGEHLVAEAATGTGKSLAYLLPALESGQRVVVATATKALQRQLLENDVPAAARTLGRQPHIVLLKGRQNYVCRRQLQSFGPVLLRSRRDEEAFEALQPWLAETTSGDRAEAPVEPSEGLWAELAVGADRCLGRRCALLSSCFAEAARQRAAEAELVVANHALYFAHLASGGSVLPDHDAVIFDEAHRLEETAAVWLGGRISRAALRRLVADVERACEEAQWPVPALASTRLERSLDALLALIAPTSGRRRLRTLPDLESQRLFEALLDLAGAIKGGGEALELSAQRAAGFAAELDASRSPDPAERVVWSEPDALVWAPVDVADALRERLWDRDGATAILVSATLTTGDGADFVRSRLGLDEARELVVGSPFDFRDQALLYLPVGVPDPQTDAYHARVGAETRALLELSQGRALILTSSYRSLERLRGALAGLPYELLVQGDEPREQLLERFRERVGSVLLATSTFWQGVDVPGESLSLLVIDKLPFSAPGDPLHEARCEAVAARGGDWFTEYALPSAVLQLRQGFGRLIRSHRDVGVVAILDPRLRTKAYGHVFLGALPPCPVVADLDAVARFFEEARGVWEREPPDPLASAPIMTG